MSRLQELIQRLCPEGVEYVPLETICQISKGVQFNKRDMKENGTCPVINGGIAPSGYIEKYNQQKNTVTVSQGGASAGYVSWLEENFWAGAHCYVLKPMNGILSRFLFHCVKAKESKLQECQYGAGIPALGKSTLAMLQIPYPPMEVQQEVVWILDQFTQLTAELTAELAARNQQFEYYRDKILVFEEEVPTVALGDVAVVTKLAGFEFTKYVRYSDSGRIIALRGLNVKNGKLDLGNVKYIDNSDFPKLTRSKLHVGDMLFTYVGTVGQVALVDEEDKYYLAPNVALIRSTDKRLNPQYMRYYFQSSGFWKTQINKLLQSSSMKNIPMEKIRKFEIPLPPLPEQRRIVAILDHFDALCNDLTSGLPAEIAARQKQYEYYRDKLLTFKERAYLSNSKK